MGQIHQSHLCSCLDNISSRPASTSTSAAASGCSMPWLRGWSPCLCAPRGQQTFTRKSLHLPRRACQCTVDFHSLSSHLSRRAHKCTIDFHSQSPVTSQERACKWSVDFHSQVNSPIKTCLQVKPPLTFTHKSPLCTSFHSGRLTTVAWFSFCGTVILLL